MKVFRTGGKSIYLIAMIVGVLPLTYFAVRWPFRDKFFICKPIASWPNNIYARDESLVLSYNVFNAPIDMTIADGASTEIRRKPKTVSSLFISASDDKPFLEEIVFDRLKMTLREVHYATEAGRKILMQECNREIKFGRCLTKMQELNDNPFACLITGDQCEEYRASSSFRTSDVTYACESQSRGP